MKEDARIIPVRDEPGGHAADARLAWTMRRAAGTAAAGMGHAGYERGDLDALERAIASRAFFYAHGRGKEICS